jgi:tetratricopeptide (TPR) repeat protein
VKLVGSHAHGLLVVVALGVSGGVAAQPTAAVTQIERDAAAASAEIDRIELQYREIPDLFAVGDRDERALWGSIYHLNKEYQRASLALFGAVEPREGETPRQVEATPTYAESLFFLADSLYELGNVGAARKYFEKLLKLRGHSYHDDAILRLMAIAAADDRFDDVDSYYKDYLEVAGTNVPGQVRYLRAKSLFRGGREDGSLQELGKIPTGEPFDLRARYLRASILTRQDKLPEALAIFDDIIRLKNVAREDAAVKELAHLGRGRLLYELDRLDESIDAYQAVEFDSKYLTTMLYEVTLTYVRRGQLELRGKKGEVKTLGERVEAAKIEYKKALRQLDDLHALDPDGERAADIDLLAGNLRLQRLEFDDAEDMFADVLEKHRAADLELQHLISDTSLRELLLKDILALEGDPRAVLESPLPPIAARRAALNKDVAASLAVFKDIQKSRADVESAQRLLEQLEELLSSENRARAELFRPLQSGVERSISLSNTVVQLTSTALNLERSLARPSADLKPQLEEVDQRRSALEEQLNQLPKTPEQAAARKQRFRDRADAADRDIHELELISAKLTAALASVSWLASHEMEPAQQEVMKLRVRQTQQELQDNDARLVAVRARVTELRRAVQTIGGRGSGEELLRAEWAQTAADERVLLRSARDSTQAALHHRLDAAIDRLAAVGTRNNSFRDNLDRGVEERLTGARTMIAAEREALAIYARTLADVDARAASLRDGATALALERVRNDLSRIVLRADVGVVDTSFGRKQAETEHISALQKARAAELTDLTQAYADLTRDELP